MNSRNTIIKLLQKAFEKMARQDPDFDAYQSNFLKELKQSPSEQISNKLFAACLEQLNKNDYPLEETLSEGRLIVSQSQIQLKKLEDLSATSQQKIDNITQPTKPHSIIEFHNELTNIIKIYQRVVIELSHAPKTHKKETYQCEDACNELQELIINLDIGDAYLKQLDDIRQKIAALNDPIKLPEYCISIISIIIDSTREERRLSRHFLYSLNDSLSDFYMNFAKNVKQAESSFDEQEQCIKTIQRKSARLKSNAEQAVNMEALRNDIFAYAENVEKLILMKEKSKTENIQFQLQNMVREIKELQDETKGYQRTINKQNTQLHIDFLTKIPNRAAWSERLEQEYNRCKRYKNPLKLAIIDVDKFKKINDSFGHLAGDKVLKAVAQTLQKSLRNVDFLARYGGEEFTVLLPEINQQQMHVALEKLCHKVKSIPFKFKKETITITISIGCTDFFDGDDLDTVFERADNALYEAKRNGRDQVIYYDKK